MKDRPVVYELCWRNKWLTADAKSGAQMAAMLESAAAEIREIFATGKVTLDVSGVPDDYAHFLTEDAEVAKRYGFTDTREMYEEDDGDLEGECDENDFDEPEEPTHVLGGSD